MPESYAQRYRTLKIDNLEVHNASWIRSGELCRSAISFNKRHHRALKMSQKATVNHILCPTGSEWDRLFAWGKVSSEEISVNFLKARSTTASGHEETFRGQYCHGCVLKTTTVGLNGHHSLWQPSRDTKHLVLSKKQKKAIQKKDKESKKKQKKKQKRLLENLIWIGTHDLMQDNVTMTERDKMGLFQTKYSVATHSFAP